MIDRVPIVDEPKVEPFFRERGRVGRGLLGETIRNFFLFLLPFVHCQINFIFICLLYLFLLLSVRNLSEYSVSSQTGSYWTDFWEFVIQRTDKSDVHMYVYISR